MKEKLYEIPLNDAMDADDECLFCFLERKAEQELMDFVLGSCASYMESDTREATDRSGFCRIHQKKMFDYGNALGNGWILKTYYKKLIKEMSEEFKEFVPGKTSLKDRLTGKGGNRNSVSTWIQEKTKTCYICDRFSEIYERYVATFFYLYKKDPAFREKLETSKGFCLHHFADLCSRADEHLNDRERKEFYPVIFKLMEENMERISGDIDWFIEKFDYLNKDADWKQSKDALQRGMQKIRGAYPADPAYKQR
ncbi:DUF6062 family protein [Lacrimispora indolis]|uniref:DUF6062 family protein n=1 Tax=Lacrimispora indolis TaxID=69825 RepID=UPI00040A8ED4|nr:MULTISPECIES: DUF6062 family protein [Lachnospiraceae]